MYEKPIVELIEFVMDDIVCSSPDLDGGLEGGEGGENDNPWG